MKLLTFLVADRNCLTFWHLVSCFFVFCSSFCPFCHGKGYTKAAKSQRIMLLDPLEMCVPCTTVLWVLLVEGTSPMVLICTSGRLHNPQSGLSSCWTSSKQTQRSLCTSRMSSQVHLQKWPRNNVR